jgi:hypothetical protein
MIEERARIL